MNIGTSKETETAREKQRKQCNKRRNIEVGENKTKRKGRGERSRR